MKKIFTKMFVPCILVFIILVSFCFNVKAAENGSKEPYTSARCAIAIDRKSNIVLYHKNAQELVPIASTTKIVTALVALKYGDLSKKVEISSRAANIHGSTVGYKKGEIVTIRELVYGLMLRSGNDAAIAIAEGISGSVDEFVNLMNEYSSEIGLCNTHFESPHGLDSDNHYSTAYDLALATCKARESKEFNDIVKAKDVDGNSFGFGRSYHNINKILWQLPDATGVKTGYTGDAGKCLVSSIDIDGNDVVIVVLNCTQRWAETKKIRDYVADNYKFKKLVSKHETLDEISMEDSKSKVKVGVNEDIIIPMKNGVNYEVKVIKPNYKVYAPISKGTEIGSICVYEDNKLLYHDSLKAQNSVSKHRWLFFK